MADLFFLLGGGRYAPPPPSSLPLPAQVCADHTIPWLSPLVSRGNKDTQCCRHCFKLPNLEAGQMAFKTSCGTARLWNAAQGAELNNGARIHGGASMPSTTRGKTHRKAGRGKPTDSDHGSRWCQEIREEAMNSTWGCLGDEAILDNTGGHWLLYFRFCDFR